MVGGILDAVVWATDSGDSHLFAVSGGPLAHRHVPAFVLPATLDRSSKCALQQV
jgi:hypothetical protein